MKSCHNCRTPLGGEKPFVQTRGSVSDQYEPEIGMVDFRYLTEQKKVEHINHTFCNDACEMEWRADRRKEKKFYRGLIK